MSTIPAKAPADESPGSRTVRTFCRTCYWVGGTLFLIWLGLVLFVFFS